MKVGAPMTQKPYSLRELTVEITGLSKTDYRFDSEYKRVERIVKSFRKTIGESGPFRKIPEDEKASFVYVTKRIYDLLSNDDTGEVDRLIKRIETGEKATEDDYTFLIEILKEGLEYDPDSENRKRTEEEVRLTEEFEDLSYEVQKILKEDLKKAEEMVNLPERNRLMKEYLNELKQNEALEKWRYKVSEQSQHDQVALQIANIAEEKGYNAQDVLEGNGSQEEITDVLADVLTEITMKNNNQ